MDKKNDNSFKIKGSKKGFLIVGLILAFIFSKSSPNIVGFENDTQIIYSVTSILTSLALNIGAFYLIYLGTKSENKKQNKTSLIIILLICIALFIWRLLN